MAIPELRFKKVDGTEYPAWEENVLSSITEKVDRKAEPDSQTPVMMISQGNGFIYQSKKYSKDNAGQSLVKYTLLKRGEMAYNHGASKLKQYGVAYCLTEEDEARIPFVYHTFKIVNGVPEYWNCALNTSQMDRQLKKLISSGARMDGLLNITYDTYMQVRIFIPCLEEQQKIADFLSDLDAVISTSEAEVAALEQQKKGAMQKIFSQEVRFRRDDGTEYPEWEEKKLGDLGSFIRGLSYNKNEVTDDKTKTLVLRSNNIIVGGVANCENGLQYVTKRPSSEQLLIKDDVIICLANGSDSLVGKTCSYNGDYIGPITVGAFCGIYRSQSPIMHYLVQTENYRRKIILIKQGGNGALANLYGNDILTLSFSIPSCLEEQQKIADFLSSFDEAIAFARQELEKWKLLKKGLMQQMFV